MRRLCNKYINSARHTAAQPKNVSELHTRHSRRLTLTGLWRLGRLRRRIADWRSDGLDRFDGLRTRIGTGTWNRNGVGFAWTRRRNRRRRRRLDRLGTMSLNRQGKRGGGSVVRHIIYPRLRSIGSQQGLCRYGCAPGWLRRLVAPDVSAALAALSVRAAQCARLVGGVAVFTRVVAVFDEAVI